MQLGHVMPCGRADLGATLPRISHVQSGPPGVISGCGGTARLLGTSPAQRLAIIFWPAMLAVLFANSCISNDTMSVDACSAGFQALREYIQPNCVHCHPLEKHAQMG